MPKRKKEEQPTFKSREVSVLSCTPGSFDHEDGEGATIITIAHNDEIEPLVLTLNDTRKLVAHALVSLWTSDDEFAEKVLAAHFEHGEDGQYHWPGLPPT